MEIVPFEKLNVTTMTVIISLNKEIMIDKDVAFHFLPTTRIDIQQTRQSSKCKLPHCKIPGSIITIGYKGMVRGIIKNKKMPFKNAVTIDMSIKEKNINLKLSSSSIQICGARSRESVMEGVNFLLNHIIKIQRMIERMRKEKQTTEDVINWIKENTRGELVERPLWEEQDYGDLILNIYRGKKEHLYKTPETKIPDNLDREMTEFFLDLIKDFLFHSDMCKKLEYMLEVPDIVNGVPEISNVNEVMVNYNYSLGFEVNRFKLNQFIKGYGGFVSRYNNALSNSVTIELPYTPLDATIKRRKNRIPHHTFLVYKSGSVTQSGPGGKLMEDVYYEFMNIISDLKPFIEYKKDFDDQQNVQLGLPSEESYAYYDSGVADANNHQVSYIYDEMFG